MNDASLYQRCLSEQVINLGIRSWVVLGDKNVRYLNIIEALL